MGNKLSQIHVLLLCRLLIFSGEIFENKQGIIISTNKWQQNLVIQGNLIIAVTERPRESVRYSQLYSI